MGKKGGRKGGLARAAGMTPEERSEAARKAVRARWAKAKDEPLPEAVPDSDAPRLPGIPPTLDDMEE